MVHAPDAHFEIHPVKRKSDDKADGYEKQIGKYKTLFIGQ
jgi:hypothetical protein